MKVILLLAVCIVAANAVLVDYDYVTFNLYTRNNPHNPQQINPNRNSINVSNFNPSNRIVIIIHDWDSNYNDRLNTGLTRALLHTDRYNVISVDWGAALSLYPTAKNAVPNVGARTARLIDFINNQYGPLAALEVVGHGLGAHIAGSVGQQVTSGRLGKIVGLDPTMKKVSYNDVNDRLSPDDALYVESIQTNGGQWGWNPPIGRANFYPNGGQDQPGCGKDIGGKCSHWCAVDYYIESILYNNYKTNKCQSYQQANARQCQTAFSNVRLGGPRNYPRGVSGIYYVPVNAQSPYGTAQIQTDN